MKITKRQLRRIIKEAVETSADPYDYDPGANYNAKAWEAWIRSEGGTPEDLDEIARIFGAPDRNSLGPVVTGAGEVSLEDALDALFNIIPPGALDDDDARWWIEGHDLDAEYTDELIKNWHK